MKKLNNKINLILELRKNGISDLKILNVIENIDRSLFVDENLNKKCNLNIALPIDCGQTISQPLVVAFMTQILELESKMRVLEIGTGSGYQTFILSKLVRFVYSIERFKTLILKAERLLKNMNVSNVFFKHGDGGLGWDDQAPFDRIIVTASAPDIPKNLINQLSINGIMIIPIGDDHEDQILQKVTKIKNKIVIDNLMKVRFVPLLEGKESK